MSTVDIAMLALGSFCLGGMVCSIACWMDRKSYREEYRARLLLRLGGDKEATRKIYEILEGGEE